jgi:hypothetical protein
VGEHLETYGVHSKNFKLWLLREFWNRQKKAPSSQALQDAVNLLTGRAMFDGEQKRVHSRVAEHAGKLYLDLADAEWRAVEITPEGWRIVKDVPVKFIRKKGMLAIPEPVRGGHLDELRQYINVADDDSFSLTKAYLVSTLRPILSFPFLVLTGEQGSSKTSQSNRIKSIIDPSRAAVRGLPRDLRDLAIAASNGWLLAFDNVSTVPQWMSDALCSLSTGGGFSTRELYSDSDERIFEYKRPVILNGIGDIVTRPDLLDRCIVLQLPVISEDKRKQESELNARFEDARPRILGALLDTAAAALKNVPTVALENLPRMADFTVWAFAAESAHSDERLFVNAYLGNRANLNQVAIDTSIIGPPILQLLNGQERWSGLLSDLLEELNSKVSESIRKSKTWPSIPGMLKAELNRLSPNLRAIGVEVRLGKRTNKGSPFELERVGKSSSPSTPSAQPKKTNGFASDDAGVDGIDVPHLSAPVKCFALNGSADSDDSDGENVSDLVEEIEI